MNRHTPGTDTPGEEGTSPPRYPRPTELAKARLIAAAPAMYETLKEIEAWTHALGVFPTGKLRAILSQIDGEG